MDPLDLVKAIKILGTLLVILAAGYSLFAKDAPEKHKRAILIAWMIAPPIFFYFEYFFQAPLLSTSELERFKNLQGLAGAIWAGVAGALAVTYFKKE